MTVKELEERVRLLEQQMQELQRERGKAENGQHFDWEKTVDKFKNNEGILEVLAEAMKLRERERRAVRAKGASRRRGPR